MAEIRPQYHQGDGKRRAVKISFKDTKDMARPEFAADTDINIMMRRLNVYRHNEPPVANAVTDDTLDLQQALDTVAQVKTQYAGLPRELKNKYASWQRLLEAIDNGTYETPAQERQRKIDEHEAAQRKRDKEIQDYLDRTRKNDDTTPSTTKE